MFKLLIEIPQIRELWELHQWKKRATFVKHQIEINNEKADKQQASNPI
jgi:hypothetical protein